MQKKLIKQSHLIAMKSLVLSLLFFTMVLILTYVVESPFLFSSQWAKESLIYLFIVDVSIFLIPLLLFIALWIRLFKPCTLKLLFWRGIITFVSLVLVYVVYYLVVDKTNLFNNLIARIDIFYMLYLYFFPALCFVIWLVVWFISLLHFMRISKKDGGNQAAKLVP